MTEGGRAYTVEQYSSPPAERLWRPTAANDPLTGLAQLAAQQARIRDDFYDMRDIGSLDVRLWTHYIVNHVSGTAFQSGVRGLVEYQDPLHAATAYAIANPVAPAAPTFQELEPTYGAGRPS